MTYRATFGANLKIALLGALIVVGAGAAQAKSGDRAGAFERIDGDADGQISQAEITAHAAARFARVDTDGNGFLTEDELSAAAEERRKKRSGRMIERLDTDEDGKVSLAEMNGRRDPAKMIERLDTDGNGTLSAEEFAQARQHGKRRGEKPASE